MRWNERERQWLIELLRERSYERKRVTLASGRESDFFIDVKQTSLTAEGHALIASLMFDAIEQLFPECEAVAGVELGGCPLASAVSLLSFERGRPLPALYVRKEVKDHGSKKLVENDRSLRPDLPVVVLEDVVTTGGSTLQSVEKLRSVGAQVLGVIAVVDRQEGGADNLRATGLRFASLTARQDFEVALAP
ncbi:MAG: orotate phosphoribosyltransferase [Polyangiaceae bacterium]